MTYIFPSQSQDQFESSNENREQNLEPAAQNNPVIVVVPYHLNVKLSDWCKNEGKAIQTISSRSGLHQVVN